MAEIVAALAQELRVVFLVYPFSRMRGRIEEGPS
jgi:hypothetical protein